MVPDRQKVQDGRNGRTDDAKTISLRLRRGINKVGGINRGSFYFDRIFFERGSSESEMQALI